MRRVSIFSENGARGIQKLSSCSLYVITRNNNHRNRIDVTLNTKLNGETSLGYLFLYVLFLTIALNIFSPPKNESNSENVDVTYLFTSNTHQ